MNIGESLANEEMQFEEHTKAWSLKLSESCQK
jgi:hypothetical protein